MFSSDIPDPINTWVTRFQTNPHCYGSFSFLPTGTSGEDYAYMAKSVGNRLLFAGEATCRTHPATVAGAYLSGLREATRIILSVERDSILRTLDLSSDDMRGPMSTTTRMRSEKKRKRGSTSFDEEEEKDGDQKRAKIIQGKGEPKEDVGDEDDDEDERDDEDEDGDKYRGIVEAVRRPSSGGLSRFLDQITPLGGDFDN